MQLLYVGEQFSNTALTVTSSTFRGNVATEADGGAVLVHSVSSGANITLLFQDCEFSSCSQ